MRKSKILDLYVGRLYKFTLKDAENVIFEDISIVYTGYGKQKIEDAYFEKYCDALKFIKQQNQAEFNKVKNHLDYIVISDKQKVDRVIWPKSKMISFSYKPYKLSWITYMLVYSSIVSQRFSKFKHFDYLMLKSDVMDQVFISAKKETDKWKEGTIDG